MNEITPLWKAEVNHYLTPQQVSDARFDALADTARRATREVAKGLEQMIDGRAWRYEICSVNVEEVFQDSPMVRVTARAVIALENPGDCEVEELAWKPPLWSQLIDAQQPELTTVVDGEERRFRLVSARLVQRIA